MALLSNNITILDAKGELGLGGTTDNILSTTAGVAGQNAYSFYGQGALSVDANKDIVLTAPVNNYKLGDFREYNHTASAPAGGVAFPIAYGPTGTTTSFDDVAYINGLNIWSFAVYGDWITKKYYLTTTARAAETGSIHTVIEPIAFSTITPLTGHTRTTNKKASTLQVISVPTFPTTSLTDPDFIYADCYISDSVGARKINLPNKTAGYYTITATKNKYPTISGGSITGVTGGVRYRNDTSGGCAGNETINLSIGTITISGYVTPMKYDTLTYRLYTTGSVSFILKRNGTTVATVYTGSITFGQTYIAFSQSGVSASYNDIFTVDCVLNSGTWSQVAC